MVEFDARIFEHTLCKIGRMKKEGKLSLNQSLVDEYKKSISVALATEV